MELLGDRMKEYESKELNFVHPTEPYIVRLDGNSFSKFTKRMKKPFDDNFMKAMCLTAGDLLIKFNPSTVYTHSDEITLIFPPALIIEEILDETDKTDEDETPKCVLIENATKTHMFNGKHSKIISLVSSYCSIRFNHHLFQLIKKHEKDYSSKYIELINDGIQIFDARILTFGDKSYEIVNHQIWRSIYDCHRNAVSTYANSVYTCKETYKKNSMQQIAMLEEKGIFWKDVPLYYKHGTYCKKSYYMKETEHGLAKRTNIKYVCFKIEFSELYENLLMSKILDKSFSDLITEDITPFITEDN